jgi:hypothetical protein
MSLNTPSQNSNSVPKHQTEASKEAIRKLLSQPEEKKIVAVQEKNFQKLLQQKKVKQLQGLPENLKARQNSNELYKILQIACSDPNYFFEKNNATISDKELIDGVVIIPSMLPESLSSSFILTI